MSDVWRARAGEWGGLYSEFQGIMGNGYMGTHLSRNKESMNGLS